MQPGDIFGCSWFCLLFCHVLYLCEVSYLKRGTTTQNTAHSVNDLDTPIHTSTQLKNLYYPQKSTKIRVIYNQQYKIVHNDTSDLHQESVSSKWCHNLQHTPPRGQPSHTIPGPTKPCTDTAHDKQKTESRITEYDTWLQTQFPWTPDDERVTLETCRALPSNKEHKKLHLVRYLYDHQCQSQHNHMY